MIRALIRANRRVCDKLAPHFPQTTPNMERLYVEKVAEHVNAKPGQVIIDVGGGRSCRFVEALEPPRRGTIIAIDVAPGEMQHNTDVDAKVVGDVTRALPLEDQSVDLIASRSVLEHLPRLEPFMREAFRVLRPGGQCIHFFPCKFALFAMANQLIPNRVAKRLLYSVFEESAGIGGFPAHYDHCHDPAFTRLLEKNGFEILWRHHGYYQAHYFSFAVPLYVLAALYEMAVAALGLKRLCAYLIVIARKPDKSHLP